jgi:hypothetical protein
MADRIELIWFWESLYTHPMYVKFRDYFHYLFKDALEKYDKVIIYSVFSNETHHPISYDNNVLHVQYSGEPAHSSKDPKNFDLNLIPSLEGDNIIPHTLAGQHLYVHNLWELLYSERNVEKDNKKNAKFCSFIVSNPNSNSRNYFFQLLNNSYKKVDSCGCFANNVGHLPPEIDTPEYFKYLSQYKFMICFENTQCDYYLTEKLMNAYLGKCIPIYWGCKQLPELVNTKALIYIDTASPEKFKEAMEKVIELDNDWDKYKAVYEQPLFVNGELPCELDADYLRKKINTIIK